MILSLLPLAQCCRRLLLVMDFYHIMRLFWVKPEFAQYLLHLLRVGVSPLRSNLISAERAFKHAILQLWCVTWNGGCYRLCQHAVLWWRRQSRPQRMTFGVPVSSLTLLDADPVVRLHHSLVALQPIHSSLGMYISRLGELTFLCLHSSLRKRVGLSYS